LRDRVGIIGKELDYETKGMPLFLIVKNKDRKTNPLASDRKIHEGGNNPDGY